VTIEVSFFEWYKWYIFGGIGLLISLLLALHVEKRADSPIILVLLAMAGLKLLSLIKGERSDDHGGGSSSGGGASGDF